jgi:hypothetical protein
LTTRLSEYSQSKYLFYCCYSLDSFLIKKDANILTTRLSEYSQSKCLFYCCECWILFTRNPCKYLFIVETLGNFTKKNYANISLAVFYCCDSLGSKLKNMQIGIYFTVASVGFFFTRNRVLLFVGFSI